MPGYTARIALVRSVLLVCFLICVIFIPQPARAGRAQSRQTYVLFFPFVRSDTSSRYIAFIPFAHSDPSLCSVIAQTPPDGSFVLAGSPFTVTWTLRNISGTTWSANSVRILYFAGIKDRSAGVYLLPYDVPPGSDLEFSITIDAPLVSGEYASNWMLAENQAPICRFEVLFRVP